MIIIICLILCKSSLMVQNKSYVSLKDLFYFQKLSHSIIMRQLVTHKGWGGIYSGTTRQRGFGGVFIGRRFQGGGLFGSLVKGLGKVATSAGKKALSSAGKSIGDIGKKAAAAGMSLGQKTIGQLGAKGKQAATKAFSGLSKQASKQVSQVGQLVQKKAQGQIGNILKKGKPWLKKQAVEAVQKVIPQKIGKFGTKQIVKAVTKAVTSGKTKPKTVPMKQLAPAEPLADEPPAEVPQEAVGYPKFLPPPPKRRAPPATKQLLGQDWRKTYGPVLKRRRLALGTAGKVVTRRAPYRKKKKRGRGTIFD